MRNCIFLFILFFGCKEQPDMVINGVPYRAYYTCTKYEYKEQLVLRMYGKTPITTRDSFKVCVEWDRQLVKMKVK